jgi:hypothetical protein
VSKGKGTSPRKIDLESLARSHTEMALRKLCGICQNGTSEAASVTAAGMILDRGWGRPKQDSTVKGDLNIVIRKMLDGE